MNIEVVLVVHKPSINKSGIELHGPGQHLGHHCYIPVVSGVAIWSVLEGKGDIGGAVGDPSLDLPTAKNENDRLVRDTHTEIDVEELMAITTEISLEMYRPPAVKKRLAAKAGCVRQARD